MILVAINMSLTPHVMMTREKEKEKIEDIVYYCFIDKCMFTHSFVLLYSLCCLPPPFFSFLPYRFYHL